MYYDNPGDALSLAKKSGFSIFVDQNSEGFPLIFSERLDPATFTIIEPGKNHKITVDQIREVVDSISTKQLTDYYVIISSAELMNSHATNAFLKLLEEPPENYHFVMQVSSASELLPTILSRGDLFVLKTNRPLEQPVFADEKVKSYAKQLISAKGTELTAVVDQLTKDSAYKKDSRGFALAVTNCATEICYKAYFSTRRLGYLQKLPRFLNLAENLKANGHIKLHLVADLC